MRRRTFLKASALFAGISAFPSLLKAATNAYLTKAEALIPALKTERQNPISLVNAVPDANQVLRFRMEKTADADALSEQTFGKGDSVIVDFGGHRTGTIEFALSATGQGVDAPVRLHLTFGEVPPDVAEPLRPYNGTLAEGWLPDETIVVDDLPQKVTIKRRFAFRYVKIHVIDTSSNFKVRFDDLHAIAVTSAGAPPLPLKSGDPMLDRIDEVSIATLRDCMQTVFEDGPRRDRRLWVGDLRLQALASYTTFGGHDLVKRCLYLFAGLARRDGLVEGSVFEKPTPAPSGIPMFDYAALWNVTLAEYFDASGDKEAALDLWPVALRQYQLLSAHVKDGLFVDPKQFWLFFDWSEALDRHASAHGILMFAFQKTLDLAKAIGRTSEVPELERLIRTMRAAAHTHFYDAKAGVYTSGPQRQVSWASQAWLILGGAARSKVMAAKALRNALRDPQAVRPATPYMYHYVVEAMVAAEMKKDALAMLKSYWGGMVAAGADTFWEVYDPQNPLSSPYGDIHINSYCHAWSCTPSWFLRSGFVS